MAARPPKEVTAEREREAWRLRIERHLTQEQIAELLEVDGSTVSRMLRRQEQRLAKEFQDHALHVKARQTAQLEEIAREAVAAWDRSLEDAVLERTVTRETAIKGADDDEFAPPVELPAVETTTTVERKGQSGNPALLGAALKAMEGVRSLWGLDAPKKTDLTSDGERLTAVFYIPENGRDLEGAGGP